MWKGYEKKGMKTMFGKRYPNCVKKEETVIEHHQKDRMVTVNNMISTKKKKNSRSYTSSVEEGAHGQSLVRTLQVDSMRRVVSHMKERILEL